MNLDSLRLGIRYSDAGIARRLYVTLYIVIRRLSMRLWSSGRQSNSFGIEFLRFCN